mmetsp:Transcript_26918/g.70769  ORF Transcript_26918/g.70769 Transcript_26918/m.70769 type:complete len:202 (-) Transcript_26918:703-1308(-)
MLLLALLPYNRHTCTPQPPVSREVAESMKSVSLNQIVPLQSASCHEDTHAFEVFEENPPGIEGDGGGQHATIAKDFRDRLTPIVNALSEQGQVQSGREAPKNADGPGSVLLAQHPCVECTVFQGERHNDSGPLQCDLLSLVAANVRDPQTYDLTPNLGMNTSGEMIAQTSTTVKPSMCPVVPPTQNCEFPSPPHVSCSEVP